MFDVTEISFCMMYSEVGGKNGLFFVYWVLLVIIRMYCRNIIYMYVYFIV